MDRKKKILIIGSSGFKRNTKEILIDSISWQRIKSKKNINICDYDILIIDLLSIVHEEVDFQKFYKIVNINKIKEIIWNNGNVIVVGDPRFNCIVDKKEKTEIPFLIWSGIEYSWDNSAGDTVNFKNDYLHQNYKEYIKHLKKW